MKPLLGKVGVALLSFVLLAGWTQAKALENFPKGLLVKLEAQGIQPASRTITVPSLMLRDLQGREHRLDEKRGKTTLLVFWSST